MSFFDEVDEPSQPPASEPRRSRSGFRSPRGPSGKPPRGPRGPSGGRTHQQEVQTRRLIAVVVIVVIVIVMALLIHGCEVSQTNDSLKNYNADVNTLITASDNNGAEMFSDLTSGQLGTTGIQTRLYRAVANARTQLARAQSLNAPSQMAAAQTALVQAMQLRLQAIEKIAAHIQGAASKSTSKDAVYAISLGTSMLYASDVLYKAFVTPGIARALNGANIAVGSGAGQQQINAGQIVPDLGWLQSTYIAQRIGAQLSTSAANANNAAPGLHGHSLNSVSVNGTQLNPAGGNTIPASSARTFVLNITNGGDFNEYAVPCKVSISGLNDVGNSTIPETIAHQTTTCSVTLPLAPPAGTYTVVASIGKVPGEANLNNNALSYSVTVN